MRSRPRKHKPTLLTWLVQVGRRLVEQEHVVIADQCERNQ
jgi:hypothetical protein